MTKQYDTQEQIEAFDAYVKRNPAGRQVHHTGTLGYEEDEWHAFQEGWNAALAQPAQEPIVGTKTWFEDGKIVTQNLRHSDVYTTPLAAPMQEPKFVRMVDGIPCITLAEHKHLMAAKEKNT